MKAVVVHDFNEGPKFEMGYSEPVTKLDEVLINVVGASLSNRARSSATGQHYTSTGKLPMIPGVDGVGILPNGKKVYFVANGSFAEQVAVEKGHWVEIPKRVDGLKVAGLMNPALSSWMALKYRADFKRNQKIMILGATGNAGSVAIQVAKRLGASDIIAVGRGEKRLENLRSLGATRWVDLEGDKEIVKKNLADAGKDVDIILDYLWGDVTAEAMWSIIPHRSSDEQDLKWVSIGTAAGQTAPLPGAAFRAVRLQLIGSGQGSVDIQDILKSFKEIIRSEKENPFDFAVEEVPLSSFEEGWNKKGGKRIVFNTSK
ncbi:quinone oxidoreductase family protein [Pediococcus claussenii]|uniref:Zinc-binding dehydrogenase family protein n=1 Tax=Pediococcus claussenii (strain ATCC BAA-344 / DSM 14800 / JCM 18046 / KCTC 3811 / LMG 21948 / P06) TaxID=701521 RepID=G8PED5_PEDCP|nr:zinc-binding alcohol dehydrogenase family protein [Pediococcus claussenii]AEV94396.1 zinc-binding dehydrogenase family protein [Pediococcus claussenii ATCC BAA-344]ANZ69617.1 alcohol dehydrogenase [Pediococcus claussenii]ANZ71434.1 alcohol dehydrogenase [Pediococcus claussenii]KRN19900.1 hypothetical protein IV79_GL001189 [Pediococcus claussenii]